MAHQEPENTLLPDPPERWVYLHGDALFRYAFLRVRRRDVAEDLVQETFLAGLRGRNTFRGSSSLRTWLVGILRNKILDYARQVARGHHENPTDPAVGELSRYFDKAHHFRTIPKNWKSDPAELLEQREFLDVLQRCLAGLTAPQAHAFILREMEDLDTERACKVLGISATNLWVRLHRARLQLRECLERNWFSEEHPPEAK